jgi:hypothetical protein
MHAARKIEGGSIRWNEDEEELPKKANNIVSKRKDQ